LTSARWLGLDGLRGVAAFVVVLRHTLNAIPLPQASLRALIESPAAVLLNAQGAVQLFFVLSGFVLASSLDGSRGRGPLARRVPAFFAKRILRIHVPYVAAVLLSWCVSFGFVASAAGPGLTPWIAQGTRVSLDFVELLPTLVFPGSARGLMPQGWTLAVELVYSLLLPAMFWLGRRSWPLLVAVSLALLFFAPPAFRGAYYAIDFSLGIALYLERERVARWLGRLGAAGTALVVVLGLALFTAPMWLGWSVWHPEQGLLVAGFRRREILLMGLGSALLVATAFGVPRVRDALSLPALAFLGRISFSLYLLHRLWIAFLAPHVDSGSRGLDALLLYAGVIALSLSTSAVFERLCDRPAIAAGRRAAAWISGSAPRPAPRPAR